METTKTNPKAVKPGTNETQFMTHLEAFFAGKFAFIKELLQNARRAGASKIDIQFDINAKTLIFTDDGEGITDWRPIVVICESGWSSNIMTTDKPFGMGTLSYLFAADEVTYSSNGQKLVLTLADMASQNEKRIQDDPSAPARGTVVTLKLKEAVARKLTEDHCYSKGSHLMQTHDLVNAQIVKSIEHNSMGFPVPVYLNNHEVARPDALDVKRFIETAIGKMQDTDGHANVIACHRLYLQGLPLFNSERTGGFVVHLDPLLFTARMPDRDSLTNEAEALSKIDLEFKKVMKNQLAKLSSTMDSKTFVEKHYEDCQFFDMKYLLNAHDFVPTRLFATVHGVNLSNSVTYFYGGVFTRDELQRLGARLWRKAHTTACVSGEDFEDDTEHAAAHLVLAQRTQATLLTGELPDHHWIHALGMDMSKATTSYIVDTPEDTGEFIEDWTSDFAQYETDVRVNFVRAKAITVVVTEGDQQIRHSVNDLPIASHRVLPGKSVDDMGMSICFTDAVKSPGQLLWHTLFSDFEREGEYRSDYEDEASQCWLEVASRILGKSTLATVKHELRNTVVAAKNQGQAVVMLSQKSPHRTLCDLFALDFDNASAWLLASKELGIPADTLRTQILSAFNQALKNEQEAIKKAETAD